MGDEAAPVPVAAPRESSDADFEKELKLHEKEDLIEMLMRERQTKAAMQKQVADLRSALQFQQGEFDFFREQADQVRHAYETDLALLFDESTSLRAEMDYDSTALSINNQRLKDELAAHVVLREQNQKLKTRLELLQQQQLDTQEAHTQEMEDLRKSVSVIKDKLIKEFRGRLHKVSQEFAEMQDAGVEGGGGGSNPGNASKQAETESHIKVIMHKYSQLEAEYEKTKLEFSLMQQSMEFQTREMLHRKRELLESRERCASLAHDLHDAKIIIERYKKENQKVVTLKEQIYETEAGTKQLKERLASSVREKVQWKSRAKTLKKELQNASSTAGRAGKKLTGKGAVHFGSGIIGRGGASQVLPVVTRGPFGHIQGGTEEGRKIRSSFDEEVMSQDDGWADEDRIGADLHGGTRGKSTNPGASQRDPGASRTVTSTGQTMNFARVFEVARTEGEIKLPDDDDEDVRRIWSSQFASSGTEGGVHMGAGVRGDVGGPRSESAPPPRVDMIRSGSSLGIGNNAQLYLPLAPKHKANAIDGRKTDPAKMFAVQIPGKAKKKDNARVLNFV